MPFVSAAQRRFMYAAHPAIAERWEQETPTGARVPRKLKAAKKSKKRSK